MRCTRSPHSAAALEGMAAEVRLGPPPGRLHEEGRATGRSARTVAREGAAHSSAGRIGSGARRWPTTASAAAALSARLPAAALALVLGGCAPADPVPLYLWPLVVLPEGAPLAWLGTFDGPGELRGVTCEAPWVAPALVRGSAPCIDEGALLLEEGERAGVCAVVAPNTPPGHTYCAIELPSGPYEIALVVQPRISGGVLQP